MSRPKGLLAACTVALVGVAANAPFAAAQPPSAASCTGVLSSFAGQAGTRDEFSPAPGAAVARLANEHGDFTYCLNVFFGGGPTP